MRVVSLVPSWTETLIDCGVEVVGRTRYCVHPYAKVTQIPAIGGTKDWQWDYVKALKPDLLVLDREENPKFMADQQEIPYVDTHVAGVADLPGELQKLGGRLMSPKLTGMARRWQSVIEHAPLADWDGKTDFPGLIEWGRRPEKTVTKIEYVIWKKPWMAVSRGTFIGSVLAHTGFANLLPAHQTKYPTIELAKPDPGTLLLFSSEPFPFAKIFKGLHELGYPYALVDGEKFSWFGVRTLRFLEQNYGIHSP